MCTQFTYNIQQLYVGCLVKFSGLMKIEIQLGQCTEEGPQYGKVHGTKSPEEGSTEESPQQKGRQKKGPQRRSTDARFTEEIHIGVMGNLGCSDLVLIFRFYHMLVFHELDLLVLRPFVKKKINLRTPHRVHARQSFHFQKIAGTLKMNIFF